MSQPPTIPGVRGVPSNKALSVASMRAIWSPQSMRNMARTVSNASHLLSPIHYQTSMFTNRALLCLGTIAYPIGMLAAFLLERMRLLTCCKTGAHTHSRNRSSEIDASHYVLSTRICVGPWFSVCDGLFISSVLCSVFIIQGLGGCRCMETQVELPAHYDLPHTYP